MDHLALTCWPKVSVIYSSHFLVANLHGPNSWWLTGPQLCGSQVSVDLGEQGERQQPDFTPCYIALYLAALHQPGCRLNRAGERRMVLENRARLVLGVFCQSSGTEAAEQVQGEQLEPPVP